MPCIRRLLFIKKALLQRKLNGGMGNGYQQMFTIYILLHGQNLSALFHVLNMRVKFRDNWWNVIVSIHNGKK